MSRNSALKSHWPALLVGLMMLGLLITTLVVGSSGRFGRAFVFTAAAIPTVAAVSQYLYMRVDRFRLLVNRTRLRLTNPESQISYSIAYTVDSLDDARATVTAVFDSDVQQSGVRLPVSVSL